MNSTQYPGIFSLEGEVALITGGGTGIGLAIAKAMASAGAKVVLVGRRKAELAAACAEIGPLASHVVHDVTDLAGAPALVEKAAGLAGPVTCLVNNAGNHVKKPAAETTEEEFETVMRTHVFAAHSLTRAVAPAMMKRGRGSILFTASMASIFGIPYIIAYTAAKSAYAGMVRGYATEFSAKGVRVNAIAPGWIETDMVRKAFDGDPARRDKILGRTPMGKLGEPVDIGWAAVYLASPAAKFVTGVMLPVDGGISIGF
ncbi:MAG TPA: SDR family oxidoreductase [Opitutaceae bacterium]|jgi:gluconate 5-dehydrogenase